MLISIRKPKPWNVSRGRIDPAFDFAWHGLVGHWLFWEGAGTRIHDLSGRRNHGTTAGNPTWSARHQTMYFDGAGDHIVIPDRDSLDIPGSNTSLTVCVHFNNTSYAASSNMTILSKRTSPAGVPTNYELSVRDFGGGNVGLRFTASHSGTNYAYDSPTQRLVVDRWYYASVVWDGIAESVLFYVDGVSWGSVSNSSRTLQATATDLWIGEATTSVFDFDGYIDDVRIYNRALRPAEIRALHANPYGPITMASIYGKAPAAAVSALRRYYDQLLVA